MWCVISPPIDRSCCVVCQSRKYHRNTNMKRNRNNERIDTSPPPVSKRVKYHRGSRIGYAAIPPPEGLYSNTIYPKQYRHQHQHQQHDIQSQSKPESQSQSQSESKSESKSNTYNEARAFVESILRNP